MALPTYVMCTTATGPWDDRRPGGVLHAAPSGLAPAHTTFCGRSTGLFWFGDVDWHDELTGERCAVCVRRAAATARHHEALRPTG
jgi:hypothetical protein